MSDRSATRRASEASDRATALEGLRSQALTCTACGLYERATQTVFGEGPANARAVLIGEQPGDREDRDGHPFVGPAGRLLDRALDDAGLDRDELYVTNAVKHFKWKRGGKVRLHQKPNAEEVRACSRWWTAELDVIEPELVVLLGATAAQAILGPKVRVTRDRGRLLEPENVRWDALVTVHPSSVLRMQDEERAHAYASLVADLEIAANYLEG
jgi:uracil-DNA glycosylase family protein